MVKGSISTKKPEQTLEPKKPVIEYNDKSYKSYIENGLDIPRNYDNKKSRQFAGIVSEKYPILRQVRTMKRERILDAETNKMREVLTYTEDWFGKDWLGKKIQVRGNIEGIWRKQNLEPVIDEESHQISGYKEGDSDIIYDIDFTPATVDSILKKTNTDPELVKYLIRTPDRRDYATYEQFKNLTWNQCTDVLLTSGGFSGAHIKEILQRATVSK